jgi:hypothetical protein
MSTSLDGEHNDDHANVVQEQQQQQPKKQQFINSFDIEYILFSEFDIDKVCSVVIFKLLFTNGHSCSLVHLCAYYKMNIDMEINRDQLSGYNTLSYSLTAPNLNSLPKCYLMVLTIVQRMQRYLL